MLKYQNSMQIKIRDAAKQAASRSFFGQKYIKPENMKSERMVYMSGTSFDYYYGNEADTYSFYRIPKTLFSDPKFAGLSCEAKVLYGLMLDRMGLSIKNNWLDGENRVFIYFTLEDVCESLSCGHDKGVKLFAELDSVKGIGLIDRVKQGLGKPCKIYVKNCIVKSEVQTSENPKSVMPENGSPDCGNPEAKTSENQKSRVPLQRSADFGKPECNNTEYIKTDKNETDLNKTDLSIYPPSSTRGSSTRSNEDRTDRIDVYREIIAENISFDYLRDSYGFDRAESVIELLTETVCSNRKSVRIGGEDMPAEVVRSRLLKLDYTHVEYVFECMDANTNKINNIRAYLLTSLYRAPTTIEPYYRAEVNHDIGGGYHKG